MNETQKPPVRIWNVPNVLSLLRMALVPVFMAAALYLPKIDGISTLVCCLVPAVIFIFTSLTDMLDGKIARKYNLITDFGKFLDPLADKFMIFCALLVILTAPLYGGIRWIAVWVSAVVMLRELGVTSLRLVVASRGVVVPASWWGKIKTTSQIVAVVVILMEPAFGSFGARHILSYAFLGLMTGTTLGSGIDYLVSLWPYVSGKK